MGQFVDATPLMFRQGVTKMRVDHSKKLDTFACGDQLRRHLIGHGAAKRPSPEPIRSVRLDGPDAAQIRGRHFLHAIDNRFTLEEAAGRNPVNRNFRRQPSRQFHRIANLTFSGMHEEQWLEGALSPDRHDVRSAAAASRAR